MFWERIECIIKVKYPVDHSIKVIERKNKVFFGVYDIETILWLEQKKNNQEGSH